MDNTSNGVVVSPFGTMKPTAETAAIAIFRVDDTADKTRLECFKTLLTSYSQEEIKKAIRVKEKAEKVAPFALHLSQVTGMDIKSAQVKHSQLRGLYKAWNNGAATAIEAASAYDKAIGVAVAWNRTLADQAKTKALHVEFGSLLAEMVPNLETVTPEDLFAAKDVATKEMQQRMADKEQDSLVKSAARAADKANGAFVLWGNAKEVAENFFGCFTTVDQAEECLIELTLIVQTAKERIAALKEKQQTEPAAVNAPEAVEVATEA